MNIRIGNAPCSWGVEFADDPRNPTWQTVLGECAAAGYKGIELGPVGFMPEDPMLLAEALSEQDLELIGGVVFRPFHDPDAWDDVLDGAVRTCKALTAHGAEHLVLIDSISPRRAPTAGRVAEAAQMSAAEWSAYRDRIATIARIGAEDYGLIPLKNSSLIALTATDSILPTIGRICDDGTEESGASSLVLRVLIGRICSAGSPAAVD